MVSTEVTATAAATRQERGRVGTGTWAGIIPSFQMARQEACSDVGASEPGFRDLLLPSSSMVWSVLYEISALPRLSLALVLTSYMSMKTVAWDKEVGRCLYLFFLPPLISGPALVPPSQFCLHSPNLPRKSYFYFFGVIDSSSL